MSTGRRLAKRSILGTRVCVPGQDGRYYPGVIQASKTTGAGGGDGGDNVYCVLVDREASPREYRERQLVGPGFSSVTSLVLRERQRVYVTYNGREVHGSVLGHRPDADEVLIAVNANPGCAPLELRKRIDDVRLLESRKSARLQDQDQDYSRLADNGPGPAENRKRPTSHVIDVPFSQRKRRPSSPDGHTGDVMDDCAAAMVLMSLSCSPKSPRLPNGHVTLQDIDLSSSSWTESGQMSPSSSSRTSSLTSVQSHNGARTPSPPLQGVVAQLPQPSSQPTLSSTTATTTTTNTNNFSDSTTTTTTNSNFNNSATFRSGLSESAPPSVPIHAFTNGTNRNGHCLAHTPTPDEGIELEYPYSMGFIDELVPRKRRNSTKTMFQCAWPGCYKLTTTCSAIEKHVRNSHLGPKNEESDMGDHEEEFYYTEIEVGVDTISDSFQGMFTSSPPTMSHMDMARPPYEDPEYQKQLQQQGSPQKLIRPNQKSLPLAPTKPSSLHRKPRGDSKKCRKIYGMENRDQWCTQCKWKKACTRFID